MDILTYVVQFKILYNETVTTLRLTTRIIYKKDYIFNVYIIIISIHSYS